MKPAETTSDELFAAVISSLADQIETKGLGNSSLRLTTSTIAFGLVAIGSFLKDIRDELRGNR